MNIFIGFSSPNKFKIGAFLIKWWLRTKYSHTYIRFENDDFSFVFHSARGMVHFQTIDRFKKESRIIEEFSIFPDSQKECLKSCLDKSGEKYGYLDLCSIAITSVAGRDIKQIGDNDGYICSEIVAFILKKHFGIEFEKRDFLITPKDIRNVFN